MQRLQVVCFTQASEQFHYWRVFAHGEGGVCIVFDKELLLQRVADAHPLIAHGDVKYRMLNKLPHSGPTQAELPFQKRWPYRDEEEYRLIYEDNETTDEPAHVPIPLLCIREVKLSPWLDKERVRERSDYIKQVPGCSRIKVYPTTVLENQKWKRWVDRC